MAFAKTGDAEITDIYCACGGVIDPKTKKCQSCEKVYSGPMPTRPEANANEKEKNSGKN